MSNLIRTQILLLALLLLLGRAGAAVPALEEQRQRFAELRERIEQGAELDVQAEIAQLRGYVLAPYLEYFYLQKRLTASPPERIATFLGKHRNLPVAGLLRESYLRQLARQERWAEYRVFYQPTADAELRCYHLRASIADKEPDPAWFEEAKSLWLVGRSQPSACDPVFDELYSREAISADQVWERVTLLIQGGNDRLAERFSAHLDPARREWLEYWLRAHRQPQDVLARPGFPLVGPYAVQVISHALQRLGRSDQELAMMFLERYGQEKFLSPRQKAELARHIALHAAYSQDPRALGWLDALPPEVVTDNVRLWTARMALRNQDWPRLLQAIAALPDRERNDPQWTYWRAHALAAIGEREAAQTEFALLAMERSYYGFLAADRLALPYNLKHVPTAVAKDTLAQVAAKPGIVRAREFFALGMMPEARREWAAAVARLNRAQQQQAALLALEMGWYDRAVVMAGRSHVLEDRPSPRSVCVDHSGVAVSSAAGGSVGGGLAIAVSVSSGVGMTGRAVSTGGLAVSAGGSFWSGTAVAGRGVSSSTGGGTGASSASRSRSISRSIRHSPDGTPSASGTASQMKRNWMTCPAKRLRSTSCVCQSAPGRMMATVSQMPLAPMTCTAPPASLPACM